MIKIKLHQALTPTVLATLVAALGSAQDLKLVGDTGRPLHDAVLQLRRLDGWLVTYQDPPYEHPEDLMNSATATTHPGESPARKHMVPRNKTISISYSAPKNGSTEERRKILDEIVERFGAAGAGSFRIYHNGEFSHIVPISVRRISGEVGRVTSICDTTVSLPDSKRSISESVNLVLSQVSEQSGVPTYLGMVPMNLFLQGQYSFGARNENACDALVRVFEDENGRRNVMGLPSVHVAWGMLYDPSEKAYYFNVGIVAPPPPPSMLLGAPRPNR